MLFTSVSLPFSFVLFALHIISFAMITYVWWEQSRNPMEMPLLSRSWSLARSVHYSLDFYCIFWCLGCSLASFLPILTLCLYVYRCSSVEDCTRYIYYVCRTATPTTCYVWSWYNVLFDSMKKLLNGMLHKTYKLYFRMDFL